VENVAHRRLHRPVAIPSSQELAVVAQLEQHLTLLNPHATAQNFGTHRQTQCRRLRSGDLATPGRLPVRERILGSLRSRNGRME
jgi:hypothetical protein